MKSGPERVRVNQVESPRIAEISALVQLQRTPGVGNRTIRKLLGRHGSPEAALAALLRRGVATAGQSGLRAEIAHWHRLGIEVLTERDSHYPSTLRTLTDPPHLLFARGSLELLARPAIAVVGSRRASRAGCEMARRLAGVAAESGLVIVSGLATGIDGEAHRGALDVNGATIAVLGAGLERPYPAAHRSLLKKIGAHGLALSEFFPDAPPERHHFPQRNRLIAALCRAVLVVEAGGRSGALITVDHALDLGREVWVVSGRFGDDGWIGGNRLIRDGARPISELADLTTALAEMGAGVVERNSSASSTTRVNRGAPEQEPTLDADEAKVWRALAEGGLSVEALARRTEMTMAHLLSTLVRLEVRSLVAREPGMRFTRSDRGEVFFDEGMRRPAG